MDLLGAEEQRVERQIVESASFVEVCFHELIKKVIRAV
jgi:hypothetical protein